MTGLVAGVGTKLAGMVIPKQAYYVLGGVAILAASYATHGCAVHTHDIAIRADEDTKLVTNAKRVTDAANKVISAANNVVRTKNAQANTRANVVATNQLVRGPGKAICPSVARPAQAPGGHQPTAGTGPTTVAQLPDSGGPVLIALPFDDTVAIIKQCEIDRNDKSAYRQQYQQLVKLWPKGNQ